MIKHFIFTFNKHFENNFPRDACMLDFPFIHSFVSLADKITFTHVSRFYMQLFFQTWIYVHFVVRWYNNSEQKHLRYGWNSDSLCFSTAAMWWNIVKMSMVLLTWEHHLTAQQTRIIGGGSSKLGVPRELSFWFPLNYGYKPQVFTSLYRFITRDNLVKWPLWNQ